MPDAINRTNAKMPPSGSAQPHILVVDDDPGQRSLLESFLSAQGFHIITADSGERALAILDTQPLNMLISDIRMPGMSGLEMLSRIRQRGLQLPTLLVTAYADIRDAVKAMQDGAANYLEKPIDLDELLTSVRRSIGISTDAQPSPVKGFDLPDHVVAQSEATRNVFIEAAMVAPSEARVLITGESGAGKEVVADMIHRWSPRAAGPMVKVNCAAIPETLLESELFGHEKGAFTGATGQRIGRFEEADGGTILLDEVAEMSPVLQAKLLRVTQDGTFQRVGSNQVRKSNTRILAATNRNLEREVQEGRFREDLYFRLNVVEIYLPPLRERQADIVPLANTFAARFLNGRPRFSPAAVSCIEVYDWPGNVRELRNAMERATLMARGELILPEHLPKRVQMVNPKHEAETEDLSQPQRLEDVERSAIIQALREHRYNRTETARALGISRRALIYKIRRFREQGYAVEPE